MANYDQVRSAVATYNDTYIEAPYEYATVSVHRDARGVCVAQPCKQQLRFRTERGVPRTGVMLVGLGGNNGTTVVAGLLANKLQLSWRTKSGLKRANWYGSLLLASTAKLGIDAEAGVDVHVPLSSLLPIVQPDSLVVGGWDLNGARLGDAMRRAEVLEITLQDQLYEHMNTIEPLPAVYVKHFIALNQEDRADNVLTGTLQEQLDTVRQHIRGFKEQNGLSKVIVLWTATTERYCDVISNVHDSASNLLKAIQEGHTEISPSVIYATAAILEGCSYINGSPQNTFVPGLIELAEQHRVFIAGDDFKSGQTKVKSVMVDFLVSAGIKPTSIISYNHLGNNDGKNLSSPAQFRSKEISKSTVVDDIVASNKILFPMPQDAPDHCVVIKYAPYVGDSKRALDEYTSEIFLGGVNTVVMHNTCEDSLLAAPIIIDLILLMEICQRISVKVGSTPEAPYEKFHSVLSILSYLCKAPLVPQGTPVVNALAAQRSCIVNVLFACLGLPPETHMGLEYKVPSMMRS